MIASLKGQCPAQKECFHGSQSKFAIVLVQEIGHKNYTKKCKSIKKFYYIVNLKFNPFFKYSNK